MDSLRSARAALAVVTLLLFAATAAWAYDMEPGWRGGGVPRTRNPDLIRSTEVRVESLTPTTVVLGSSASYRPAKPYSPASHKSAKKAKKPKKRAKKTMTPDPSVQHGKVTDGDPVLAKP